MFYGAQVYTAVGFAEPTGPRQRDLRFAPTGGVNMIDWIFLTLVINRAKPYLFNITKVPPIPR